MQMAVSLLGYIASLVCTTRGGQSYLKRNVDETLNDDFSQKSNADAFFKVIPMKR
jgi:hypothetical protein